MQYLMYLVELDFLVARGRTADVTKRNKHLWVQARCPGGGSEGSGPTPAPAHGRFYTYVLNNMDVVITIIYSQKYLLFEIMYTYGSYMYIWDFKYSDR